MPKKGQKVQLVVLLQSAWFLKVGPSNLLCMQTCCTGAVWNLRGRTLSSLTHGNEMQVRWALKHHGVAYKVIGYTPLVSLFFLCILSSTQRQSHVSLGI